MEIRHQFDGKKVKVALDCSKEPSLTKQAFAKACDVNEILRKYEKTGLPPEMRQGGKYGDFSTAPEYHEALNTVIRAQALFEALPAKARSEWENDPAKFLEFVHDPKNATRLVELGLANAPKAPEVPSGATEASSQAISGTAAVAAAK